jgi:hypothetical protein
MKDCSRINGIVTLTIASLVLVMPTLGRASTAPYPRSQVITTMTWDFSTALGPRNAAGSDVWAMTWGPDGTPYGAWGNGSGFDGIQDSTPVGGSGAVQNDATTPLVIAHRAVASARGFNGGIDDGYVFDHLLSAVEIRNLATGNAGAANVTLHSVSTCKYSTLSTTEVGTLAFIDRTYTITDVSAKLAGNDKTITSPTYLQLTLDRAGTVYLCYSSLFRRLAAWLNDGSWVLQSDVCDVNDGAASSRLVYRKVSSAGEVTLGGNREAPASKPAGHSIDTVMVAP